jgi:hypothetical protein
VTELLFEKIEDNAKAADVKTGYNVMLTIEEVLFSPFLVRTRIIYFFIPAFELK